MLEIRSVYGLLSVTSQNSSDSDKDATSAFSVLLVITLNISNFFPVYTLPTYIYSSLHFSRLQIMKLLTLD